MPTYEVQYRDGHSSMVHGNTRSQAKYNKFIDVADCFESFVDFLKFVRSVRKVQPPASTYDFIERQYGMRFSVGQRVDITGEGVDTKSGEVIYPLCGNGAYVSVHVDGRDVAGLFHPMSLTSSRSSVAEKE